MRLSEIVGSDHVERSWEVTCCHLNPSFHSAGDGTRAMEDPDEDDPDDKACHVSLQDACHLSLQDACHLSLQDACHVFSEGRVPTITTSLDHHPCISSLPSSSNEHDDVVNMFILKAENLRRKFFVKRVFQKPSEGTSTSTQMLQNLRQTTPRAETRVIVGLNEEAEKLVEQLTTGDPRRRVVSIVGIGGIGKTTLAKKVYNHSRVVDHFQSCLAKKVEKLQENELGDFLHDHLKRKRLLLTTRNKDVVVPAKALMPTMNSGKDGEEMCWFTTGHCCLGGLLSSKKQLSTVWEKVLNKLGMHFACSNGVDAILSLSYTDLAHNLKSCFLYLGLFPKEQVIPKRTVEEEPALN
ncbi:putative disease resistance protein [Vitis vinifera]|uniref:Putative disease resistance protein n=1 Tax=Vitis vinifera TaxID=29760 RepID=A0A438BQE0_VITVI|nr:putative disease resistance protein [Vitis vinifera]